MTALPILSHSQQPQPKVVRQAPGKTPTLGARCGLSKPWTECLTPRLQSWFCRPWARRPGPAPPFSGTRRTLLSLPDSAFKQPMPEAAEPQRADRLTVRKGPSRERRAGRGPGRGWRGAAGPGTYGELAGSVPHSPPATAGLRLEMGSRRKGNWSVGNREVRPFSTNNTPHSPGQG